MTTTRITVTPLHMTTQKLGKNLLFYSNLDVNPKQIYHFPQYYQKILRKWSSNLSVSPNIPSTITSQVIWFNFKTDYQHIKININTLRLITNLYAIIV